MKIHSAISAQNVLASAFVILSFFFASQKEKYPNTYQAIASGQKTGFAPNPPNYSSLRGQSKQLDKGSIEADANKENSVALILQSDLVPKKSQDLPQLDSEILNVTAGAAGFGSNRFESAKRLALKYDQEKIPVGYSLFDVYTFRYDSTAVSWVRLERLGVDLENAAIVSEISKDGDFINGIIRAPDAPETQGYAPTTVSDVKIADPSSEIQLIQPPKINSDGTAQLSYPIECAPGRHGIGPNLSVNYNSDAGAGNLGEGWSLSGLSGISIDTRWGVPLYDKSTETETYLLDGKMLVLGDQRNDQEGVLSHRSPGVPRQAGDNRRFFERKEVSFNKIERFGSGPSDYYWVVTEKKSGVKYYYGARKIINDGQQILVRQDDAVLREAVDSPIAEWRLSYVEDPFGNYMEVRYTAQSISFQRNTIKCLNPSSVSYTKNITNSALVTYQVQFEYEGLSPERVVFSARTGFLTSTNSQRIKHIKVVLAEWTLGVRDPIKTHPIKKYGFRYKEGAFGKQLLAGIDVFGYNQKREEVPFVGNSHSFDYFTIDDVGGAFDRNVIVSTGVVNPIGSSSTIPNANFGLFVGVGGGSDVNSKSTTIGGQMSYSRSTTEGKTSLVDIDGNGLPDIVCKEGGTVRYYPNMSKGSELRFGPAKLVSGVSDFSLDENESNSSGWQVNGPGVAPVFYGQDWNDSKTKTRTYFQDVNADGLPDLVEDGIVRFNQSKTVAEAINFSSTSQNTANPIWKGKSIDPKFQKSAQEIQIEREKNVLISPLIDMVKVWVSPAKGRIQINAPVRMLPPVFPSSSPLYAERYAKNDGVVVSIQKNEIKKVGALERNAFLYNPLVISREDFSEKISSPITVDVNKGDRIIFRLQSGGTKYANGDFDKVVWNPVIEFKTDNKNIIDVFDKDQYLFDARKDFIVEKEAVELPGKGIFSIKGSFKKEQTSDSVQVTIRLLSSEKTHKLPDTTVIVKFRENNVDSEQAVVIRDRYAYKEKVSNLFSEPFGASAVSKDIELTGVSYEKDSKLFISMEGMSNINRKAITWNPLVIATHTDSVTNPDRLEIDTIRSLPKFYFKGDLLGVGRLTRFKDSVKIQVIPDVKFKTKSKIKMIVSSSKGVLRKTIINHDSAQEPIEFLLGQDEDFFISYEMNNLLDCIETTPTLGGHLPRYRISYFGHGSWTAPEKGVYSFTPAAGETFDNIVYRVGSNPVALPASQLSAGIGVNEGELVRLFSQANNEPVSFKVSNKAWLDAVVWTNVEDTYLGPLYRGWGHFAVNKSDNVGGLLDASIMKPSETVQTDITKTKFFSLAPNSRLESFQGPTSQHFISGDTISVSRLTMTDVNPVDVFSATAIAGDHIAIGVSKQGSGESKSESKGAIIIVSESSGSSVQKSDFVDLNGDRYPDLISDQRAQYTNGKGGLSRTVDFATPLSPSKTTQTAKGKNLGGFFNHTLSRMTASKSEDSKKNSQAGAETALTLIGLFPLSGAGANSTTDTMEDGLYDINGDGLPDQIRNGAVHLNLGYSFSPTPIKGSFPSTRVNRSETTVFGGGYNFANNSASAGYNISNTQSWQDVTFADINGDGLLDQVVKTPDGLQVICGLGSGMSGNPIRAVGISEYSSNVSDSKGAGGSFTAGFTIFFVKVVFSPSANLGMGSSGTRKQFLDFNGDGYVDYLESDGKTKEVRVRLSNLGRVNRMKVVSRPLKGGFALDYKQSEAKYEHPGGKWVLSSVIEDDGVQDDGLNPKSTFDYKNGIFDRYERQFLGFEKTIETQYNEDKIYRRLVTEYRNTNFYESGNIAREYIENSKGERYIETAYTYLLYSRRDIKSHRNRALTNAVVPYYNGILQAPLHSQTSISYEGKNSSPLILNEMLFKDNEFGDVSSFRYSDKGRLQSHGIFDYEVSIRYLNFDTNQNYMAGLPKAYEVKSNKGELLRKQEVEYYGWTEKSPENKEVRMGRRIKSRSVTLDESSTAVTGFEYDYVYGNLQRVTLPNRVYFNYLYEDITKTHVRKITDAYNLTNEFGYTLESLRFGRYGQQQFTNKRSLKYSFDDFGRVDTIVGAKQISNQQGVKAYTISFAYHPEGDPGKRIPYAVTRHFDLLHASDGIYTINFVDGQGKSLQTKKTGSVDGIKKWIVNGRKRFDQLGRELQTYYPTTQEYFSPDVGVDQLSRQFAEAFDSEAAPTIASFDILDRQLELSLPDGKLFSSNSYDVALDGFGKRGLRTSTVYTDTKDANKKETIFDGSGQISTEISYLEKDGSGSTKTTYRYDPIHQLEAVYNNRGIASIVNKYDMGGRKTESANNSGGTVQFKYDEAGNLVKKINGRGQSVTYNYDRNRISSIEYSDHPQDFVRYFYQALEINKDDLGKPIYIEDGTGAQAFEYDEMGNVKKNTRTVIVPFGRTYTYSTTFEYDSWGKLLNMMYPDGQSVKYGYNQAGQLIKVSGRGKDSNMDDFLYITDIRYDKFGQRKSITWGNGIKADYTYEINKRRRLEEIKSFAKDGSELFKSGYRYDDLNNITQVSNVSQKNNNIMGLTMTHSYQYNNLNQLFFGEGKWDQGGSNQASFELKLSYDDLYNIKERRLNLLSRKVSRETNAVYTYSEKQPMQLASLTERVKRNNKKQYQEVNKDSYLYDRDGNDKMTSVADSFQLGINERKIYWDVENRMRTVSVNGYVSSYTYDVNGERTVKLSSQGTGRYVNGKLAKERISGTSISMYVNPYYSVRNGGAIGTKHIYVGEERIVSQLSDQKNWVATLSPESSVLKLVDYPTTGSNHITDYSGRRTQAEKAISGFYDSLGVPHAVIPANAFENRIVSNLPLPANPINPAANMGKPDEASVPKGEPIRYFYHANHLGSTNYISDKDGKVVQYVEHLPFGETFMEQRLSYSSQFLFNGKEQDQETGLYYYGARYYDPHTYQWLGVDPMTSKYPGISPYNFNFNNPIRMVDLTGAEAEDIFQEKWQEYQAKNPNWKIDMMVKDFEKSKDCKNGCFTVASVDYSSGRKSNENVNADILWGMAKDKTLDEAFGAVEKYKPTQSERRFFNSLPSLGSKGSNWSNIKTLASRADMILKYGGPAVEIYQDPADGLLSTGISVLMWGVGITGTAASGLGALFVPSKLGNSEIRPENLQKMKRNHESLRILH